MEAGFAKVTVRRGFTAAEFARNGYAFYDACKGAGVKATVRQARKFLARRGAAFNAITKRNAA